eukprot:CAMPEP_0202905494 /NCGR_PEP_ID=MMETSP1392-20130828/34520_1 /ASSEMBLY_ACC=CAM_ASM_000868 /TAXON_ID=225041 /ORGANISM="Chlamydomonas chlamydogama, Strain SAG 11-48b" /LENGTH=95 /DNA_ID=CAMNT_0049593595 /DNA_START=152 /DNA_END=439 /DNA_ORIENTATION=-
MSSAINDTTVNEGKATWATWGAQASKTFTGLFAKKDKDASAVKDGAAKTSHKKSQSLGGEMELSEFVTPRTSHTEPKNPGEELQHPTMVRVSHPL